MTKLMVRIQNDIAAREERGAAMAEYGLLLALVALAAIVILSQFGDSITGVFQKADDRLQEGITDSEGGGEEEAAE
jgi:Flp pilus assembly pilin Flp